MSRYDDLQRDLRARPARWLVTGGAGFIGSHICETLLRLGQDVVVLDNFATGHRSNLEHVLGIEGGLARRRLHVIEGDIRDPAACRRACEGATYVLHQAALGSVPRSIKDPVTSHDVNVTGFLNVFLAARDANVRRLVYASSSSVYGDHPVLPKVEDQIGNPLSPYAATKRANEIYAVALGRAYGVEAIGLRYFNVFGPRQDPNGPYAAVMPLWFAGLLRGEQVVINGDGETSRDFCFVANIVQANLLAATTEERDELRTVFNVAVGERTTLVELFRLIRSEVARFRPECARAEPVHREFRAGDVRHSLADVSRARRLLGYEPTHTVTAGLRDSAEWYATHAAR